MSIQSNINQMLSLPSLLVTQSPMAKHRKEALAIRGAAISAEKGITDIIDNLEKGKFEGTPGKDGIIHEHPYKDYELEDIGERLEGYRKDIYNSKVARVNPNYKKFMGKEPEKLKRPEFLDKVDRIIAAKNTALERLRSDAAQKEASKAFVKTITEGVYSPLTDIRKGDTNA